MMEVYFMLDVSPSVTVFEVHMPWQEGKNESLVLIGCNAYLKSGEWEETDVYSEMEELSYSYLNSNDTMGRKLEIELCFSNNQKNAYQCFWANCFSIRTDSGLVLKLCKRHWDKAYSKVNMNNEMVLGVGCFIEKNVYEKMLNAKNIVIEGCVALEKYSNTYGVSVQLKKEENDYKLKYANTYRFAKCDDIRNKVH